MNLREMAKKALTLSELMSGRTKISTDDICMNYDGIISICDVDLVHQGEATYCVIHFTENENVFYCTGMVLTNLFRDWIEQMGLEGLRANLKKEPLQVKLSQEKTKDGKNNVTRVEVL